jgi:F-type H+-transporting ATPase subunit gamma
MPSAREINRRIKSVTNTQQITKAMKMVSSVRLRHAQERAMATAPYTANRIEGLLRRLSAAFARCGQRSLLQAARSQSATCYIVIGSDKGLAGAFNSNINKATVAELKDKPRSIRWPSSPSVVQACMEYLKHLRVTCRFHREVRIFGQTGV